MFGDILDAATDNVANMVRGSGCLSMLVVLFAIVVLIAVVVFILSFAGLLVLL